MIAIITGDIINSRNVEPTTWLNVLKNVLSNYGETPNDWEIFRGDSFQIAVPVDEALFVAFIIKSEIKKNQNIDVRMGIGIGDTTHRSTKITEANGTAFIHSGQAFDSLKKQTIALKSPWEKLNDSVNTMLKLADLIMERWTEKSTEAFSIKLKNPDMNQVEIAEILQKSQGNISEDLNRAGYDELKELLNYYKNQIKEIC